MEIINGIPNIISSIVSTVVLFIIALPIIFATETFETPETNKLNFKNIIVFLLIFIIPMVGLIIYNFNVSSQIHINNISSRKVAMKNEQFQNIILTYNINDLPFDNYIKIDSETINITDNLGSKYKPALTIGKQPIIANDMIANVLFDIDNPYEFTIKKKGKQHLNILIPKVKENAKLLRIDLNSFVIVYDLKEDKLFSINFNNPYFNSNLKH